MLYEDSDKEDIDLGSIEPLVVDGDSSTACDSSVNSDTTPYSMHSSNQQMNQDVPKQICIPSKKREQIREGDVVEVCNDAKDRLLTSVQSAASMADGTLCITFLDNGIVLGERSFLRRVKIRSGRTLVEHRGKFRHAKTGFKARQSGDNLK